MRHWSQLATRNWRAKRLRAAGALLAIALGTAAVVWVTCCYESVRRSVADWASGYIGSAHITISSPLGKYGTLPERIVSAARALPEVKQATPMLIQRVHALPWTRAALESGAALPERDSGGVPQVDIQGVEVPEEFNIRQYKLIEGRMIRPDDRDACIVDESLATEGNVKLGDYLMVWSESSTPPRPLRIVGLITRRTIGRLQRYMAATPLPVLQEMMTKQQLVTTVDIVLKDPGTRPARRPRLSLVDQDIEEGPSAAELAQASLHVRAILQRIARDALVRTVDARMQQIQTAQSQQQLVLVLLSCVAMLTSLFIILSTLSMGMVERIAQLGLLRCIGVTGPQLAALMFIEVTPLGVIGVVLGVPIGLLLTRLTVVLVPEYVGKFAISYSGIALAMLAGLLTTLVAAILPAFAALRVSPMEAARPRARRTRLTPLLLTAALAGLLLAVEHFGLFPRLQRASYYFVERAALSVVLLYVGYALLAAPVVRLIGGPAVTAAAAGLRVRARLLHDQVGHAVWRSAGICCGLMVGLSLIIGVLVVNQSVTSGWQFPKQFPEAYIWTFSEFPPNAQEMLATVSGVGQMTAANSINVIVDEKPLFMEQVVRSVTWFMGCDPNSFFDMIRVEFVEGDPAEAIAKLKQGGHVVVADDFARTRNKHVGDSVRVYFANVVRDFRVAGVVQSPALDVAAGYFQAQTEFQVAASGSVIGTNDDLKKYFNQNATKLVLLNFNLPPEPPPPGWPPPRGSPQAAGLYAGAYNSELSLERRWERQQAEQVLRACRDKLSDPEAFIGTARELKDEIDTEITRITRLITAVPGMALIIAALGVANLMTANVASRSRQIAMLRAVGATRNLILRMVIGEALVLGLLGCGLGALLGLHLANNVNTLISRMWGLRVEFDLPWPYLLGVAGLTVALCLIAGLLPARHASRTNIVDALHVA